MTDRVEKIHRSRRLAVAAAFALPLMMSAPALAQTPHGGHGHQHGTLAPAAQGTNQAMLEELRAANERMHAAMSQELTGDPDRDFARAMIPHHQGAVEMAEIVLKYGQDPELRQLAQEVIETQQKEIEFLKNWLERQQAQR